jgi:hypothetical protein
VTYTVAEAELGVVQSKATKLVIFVRFRLGCEHTPRSKGLLEFGEGHCGFFLFPSNQILKL